MKGWNVFTQDQNSTLFKENVGPEHLHCLENTHRCSNECVFMGKDGGFGGWFSTMDIFPEKSLWKVMIYVVSE